MRLLLVVSIGLLLWNCEDKQTSKQTNTQAIKDSVVNKTKTPQTPKNETAPLYAKLTDNNAMEFF